MKVLFLDTVHPALEQALEAEGLACYHDYSSNHEELKSKIEEYNGIVVRSRVPIDEALLAQAHNLKWIARSGAGLENIDLAYAKKRNITVHSSPEGNRDAVGEHCIGMLLMLMNRLHLAHAEVQSGLWRREANRGYELAGKTVGIIGHGHMGSSLSEKLQGFGCHLLAYDKYKELKGIKHAEVCELQYLLDHADIISIHLPLSDETRHYVNDAFIEAVRKPFYLINTARGQHVDTSALLRGLDSGKVLGACLDVLEFEKRSLEGLEAGQLPEQLVALRKHEKVVLSPHVAGWTHESYRKLSEVLAAKICGQDRSRNP